METVKIFLRNLVMTSESKNNLFKRTLLKEYLQVIVLDYLYSHPQYSDLVFYGGSCLAHCFGLNRLSEDLDFVDIGKKIDNSRLAKDIEFYFKKSTDLDVTATVQKFRVYLKFPILRELNLAAQSESDLLFLKVEVFKEFDFCSKYQTQIIPLMKFNRTMLIKTFDLPTLMATKIRAIFHRKWEKTDKTGKTLIKVKGRDYFDLMWYLGKGISPNLDCIEGVETKEELKKRLLAIIENMDSKSIQLDLEQFIENEQFLGNLGKNIKEILLREVEGKF